MKELVFLIQKDFVAYNQRDILLPVLSLRDN